MQVQKPRSIHRDVSKYAAAENDNHENLGPWGEDESTKYSFGLTQPKFKNYSSNPPSEKVSPEKSASPFKSKPLEIDPQATSSQTKMPFINLSQQRFKRLVEHDMPKTNIESYFKRRFSKKLWLGTSSPRKRSSEVGLDVPNNFQTNTVKKPDTVARLERFKSLPLVNNVKKQLEIERQIYRIKNKQKQHQIAQIKKLRTIERKPSLDIGLNTTPNIEIGVTRAVSSKKSNIPRAIGLKETGVPLRQTIYPISNKLAIVQKPDLSKVMKLIEVEEDKMVLSNQLIRKKIESK